MSSLRYLLFLTACFALATGGGCTTEKDALIRARKQGAQAAVKDKTDAPTGDAKPKEDSTGVKEKPVPSKPKVVAPARVFKSAKELLTPPGLSDPVTETKLPKSTWSGFQDARVGDFTVYDTGGTLKMRTEIFDIADHAVVQLIDITIKAGDVEMKSKSGIKLVFSEPDMPADPKAESKPKVEKKPSSRAFTDGGKKYSADTVVEVYVEGKLASKTWTSKELLPGDSFLMEDGDGKVLRTLLDFGRGR